MNVEHIHNFGGPHIVVPENSFSIEFGNRESNNFSLLKNVMKGILWDMIFILIFNAKIEVEEYLFNDVEH